MTQKIQNQKNEINQVRCDCGKLCLVKTKEGYEFKCTRCKRIHLLRYEDLIVDYFTKEEKTPR